VQSEIKIKRRPTWTVRAGDLCIGSEHPISVQSMCATPTRDIPATLQQIRLLQSAGADLIRIAVDSRQDVEALSNLRQETDARLVIDLQESYRLAEKVAPFVQKIRYNPGHLHHHQKQVEVFDKVKYLVEVAATNDCALRIGINFGSLDPEKKLEGVDPIEAALESAQEHISYMERLGFENYLVSLKSSDPNAVMSINREFANRFERIPLHLGVTEAGMLPMGEIKTRIAFENLIANGIGDTVRVSLTLPFERKYEEIEVARKILKDISEGKFRSVPQFEQKGLNIISCPSCSRVENLAFIELAEKVKELTAFAAEENLTIAVMGCRVNGPGETDDADLGLWCAPNHVNLKRKEEFLGTFSYEQILVKVEEELRSIISERREAP